MNTINNQRLSDLSGYDNSYDDEFLEREFGNSRGKQYAPRDRGRQPRDIVSLPASVRRHLEEAERLERQQQTQLATEMFKTAGAELARSNPQLFTLLMLAMTGHSGYSVSKTVYGPAYTGMGKMLAAFQGKDPEALKVLHQQQQSIRLIR